MKNPYFIKFTWMLSLIFVFSISDLAQAQRMAGRGAATRPAASRPASARPAPSQGARPTTRPASKPATSPSTRPASRPTTSQASRPTTKPATRPATSNTGSYNKPGSMNGGSNRVTQPSRVDGKVGSVKNDKVASRPSNSNSGNRGNNGRGDVNINIDNSRNTVIRNNRNVAYRPYYRPYPRPPYYWGGYGFSWYRPYYYHPYRPYYWGPVWHPWGFFVATIAVTAIIVSVNEQQYQYDQGVFYVQSDGGYVVVEAPQGATVKVIPKESEVVEVSPTVNNYYYGGTFYEQKDGTYTVVPPPAGSVVSNLPEGAEEVKVGDQTFVKYGDTYYMPVEVDGKDMYEVVQVEEDK